MILGRFWVKILGRFGSKKASFDPFSPFFSRFRDIFAKPPCSVPLNSVPLRLHNLSNSGLNSSISNIQTVNSSTANLMRNSSNLTDTTPHSSALSTRNLTSNLNSNLTNPNLSFVVQNGLQNFQKQNSQNNAIQSSHPQTSLATSIAMTTPVINQQLIVSTKNQQQQITTPIVSSPSLNHVQKFEFTKQESISPTNLPQYNNIATTAATSAMVTSDQSVISSLSPGNNMCTEKLKKIA